MSTERLTGSILSDAGSMWKRAFLVCWEAVKKIPFGFQSTTDLFSSKAAAISLDAGAEETGLMKSRLFR